MSISIVTVHLDDFSGLERTCESLQALRSQSKLQWIVIDGASLPANDEQRKILDSTRRLSDNFISEPDSGIYEAMNKGARMAREQYLLFLNAGDCLHHDFNLPQIFRGFRSSCPDMIWGSYNETGKSNQMLDIRPRNKKWLWWGMPNSHQAILFRRQFLGSDPYDENLKFAGDYDLVLKLVNRDATIFSTSMPICIADGTGISNTKQISALAEQMAVRKRHFGTSSVINWSVSVAHLMIGWIGRFRFLRKLWK